MALARPPAPPNAGAVREHPGFAVRCITDAFYVFPGVAPARAVEETGLFLGRERKAAAVNALLRNRRPLGAVFAGCAFSFSSPHLDGPQACQANAYKIIRLFLTRHSGRRGC